MSARPVPASTHFLGTGSGSLSRPRGLVRRGGHGLARLSQARPTQAPPDGCPLPTQPCLQLRGFEAQRWPPPCHPGLLPPPQASVWTGHRGDPVSWPACPRQVDPAAWRGRGMQLQLCELSPSLSALGSSSTNMDLGASAKRGLTGKRGQAEGWTGTPPPTTPPTPFSLSQELVTNRASLQNALFDELEYSIGPIHPSQFSPHTLTRMHSLLAHMHTHLHTHMHTHLHTYTHIHTHALTLP